MTENNKHTQYFMLSIPSTVNFGSAFDVPQVLTSSSGSNMEGEMYSLHDVFINSQ